jgi:serine/threonine-protein kinase
MGSVYRAYHVDLGRSVAVKFLPDDLAKEAGFQTRFEREARALAMLSHPHIVTVYDFDASERPYIVMELAAGGSLADQLPLERGRAIEIALQICAALEFAHSHGVIHRDVKPQNVLLDSSGQVKVSDFDLERLIHPDARGWTVTAANQAVGTPHYMAPESLDGAPPGSSHGRVFARCPALSNAHR